MSAGRRGGKPRNCVFQWVHVTSKCGVLHCQGHGGRGRRGGELGDRGGETLNFPYQARIA